MKILVPLNGESHLASYIEAGADEFYLGFYDETWDSTFGEHRFLNRMSGFKNRANQCNLDQVVYLTKKIKSAGAAAYVTMNSTTYSQDELKYLLNYVSVLKKAGVDGIIVSTPDLALLLNQHEIPVVASTMCGIYNEDLVRYYKNLRVKRVILPRDLSLKEIEQIMKQCPDIEFEVFLMRNGCVFSDSNCLCIHRNERGALCGNLRYAARKIQSSESSFEQQHETEMNDIFYSRFFHKNACSLCSLYSLNKLGVHTGKIVGRADDWKGVYRDIMLVKKNMQIAQSCKSENEYLNKMIFPENRYDLCKLGLNCYYPESRFK